MRRREALITLGAALLKRLPAAQQPRNLWTARAGYIRPLPPIRAVSLEFAAPRAGLFRRQRHQLDVRFAEGRDEHCPLLAVELVRPWDVALIVDKTPAALAAKQPTSTMPIVVAAVGNLIGLVSSPACSHPGGNFTGFSAVNSRA